MFLVNWCGLRAFVALRARLRGRGHRVHSARRTCAEFCRRTTVLHIHKCIFSRLAALLWCEETQ